MTRSEAQKAAWQKKHEADMAVIRTAYEKKIAEQNKPVSSFQLKTLVSHIARAGLNIEVSPETTQIEFDAIMESCCKKICGV